MNTIYQNISTCGCFFSVGRPKHVRVMAGALEGDIFYGPKAEVEPECFIFEHIVCKINCSASLIYETWFTYFLT